MYIFVLGWNITTEQQKNTLVELHECHKRFSWLDKNSLWNTGSDYSVFAASIQGSKSNITPRIYQSTQKSTTILYHGCMVDPDNEFASWDARVLHKHWKDINRLEGLYVLAKISTQKYTLEIQTDPLGVYQVYYVRRDNSWLISNNATVIKNILGLSELDSVGMSMFLSLGWVSGDNTFLQEIKVMPGGQRWVWKNKKNVLEKNIYFDRKSVATIKHHNLSKQNIVQLGDKLSSYFSILENNFNSLDCPITGGRDSRTMVALLMHRKLSAKYYTWGVTDSDDVKVGVDVARNLNLEHECRGNSKEQVLADWPQIRDRLIYQNDGMVSLSCAGAALEQSNSTNSMRILLYGIGGEIGRAYYYSKNIRFLRNAHNPEYIIPLLRRQAMKNNLIRENTHYYADNFINIFCQESLGNGFPVSNLPDIFYAFERVRRWAGTYIRPNWPNLDIFSPFCTRPFIEAAFSLPLLLRQTEHIHYRLINELTPQLNAIPYIQKWRSQSPTVYRLQILNTRLKARLNKYVGRSKNANVGNQNNQYSRSALADERSMILEAVIQNEREFCLDNANSLVWEFVNRQNFNKLISHNTSSDKRIENHMFIYSVLTLLHYIKSV